MRCLKASWSTEKLRARFHLRTFGRSSAPRHSTGNVKARRGRRLSSFRYRCRASLATTLVIPSHTAVHNAFSVCTEVLSALPVTKHARPLLLSSLFYRSSLVSYVFAFALSSMPLRTASRSWSIDQTQVVSRVPLHFQVEESSIIDHRASEVLESPHNA